MHRASGYRALSLGAALAALVVAGAAEARDRIRIVGSSTVFPFATTVAETFGKTTNFKTPVVESTGTGGGIKLFCAGLGTRHPDIVTASRRIKRGELARCAKGGVDAITEVKIGYDGIVLANAKSAPRIKLTLRQLWLALAKTTPAGNKDGGKLVANPNRTWRDIDPSLPAGKIEVLGPPPTSGTRDAFVELAMEGGCKTFPKVAAIEKIDKNKFKAICHAIREDGAYVEAGENDNLIVQKLVANAGAFGIFGFSFLDQNTDKVQGAMIGGVAPSFENIADQSYPIARSLYIYVKNGHAASIPGIREYLAEFTSENAAGPDGYLAEKGLIPLSVKQRREVRRRAAALTPFTM